MFADVILPLPLANHYTYLIPEDLESKVKEGCRVIVPFGKKKFYSAIVIRLHEQRPEGYEIKEVSEVLDSHPILLPGQLDFWRWVSSYYLCTLGDVYKAALPSGLKLESETLVEVNPEYEAESPLAPNETLIYDLLSDGKVRNLDTLSKESGIRQLLPIINSLLEKEAIFVKEEVRQTYKPKTEAHVRLACLVVDESTINSFLDATRRAPKQQTLLIKYLELSGLSDNIQTPSEVSKRTLLNETGYSSTILNSLVEKGILEIYYYEIGRLGKDEKIQGTSYPLNSYQQKAFEQINEHFREKNVCLLHGVTSSGKTEIYIHLIQQALSKGEQVLYLLPEIALTTQITERLKRVFGSRLGVYHSKFPDTERVEIWQKQLSAEPYDIILGVRSSVFLPFRNLGLVIIDEEHENTYKQQDPAPRYHARNAAIVLASKQNAKVLLGTATPSIESYYNAQTGKYGFVRLTQRHKALQLPEIEVVDIGELRHKRRMNGPFSPRLLEEMRKALESHEQIILFQNRRGFAPMLECKVCGWTPRCEHCDVSLTYHRGLGQLTCHYCGYTTPVPHRCPACESEEIRHRGFGTERIEENIQELFPEARIARMDLDTTRTRQAYERIILNFRQGDTDILIGTQMVSKGLDFEHVSVVGILDADSMMNFPDFRAHERAFQLMAQVAGRAGRKHKQGIVILQTRSKDAPVISQVMHNDYEGLYNDQLAERMLFRYPPYFRLINIYLKHRYSEQLDRMAHEVADRLRRVFGDRVLGPDAPPVARIQSLYIRKIIIKMEVSASLLKVREQLLHIRQQLLTDEQFRSLTLYFDMDPC